MTSVNEIVSLLASQRAWRGFPQIKHYLREQRTRADIRALAKISTRPEILDRPDYSARSCRIALAGSRSTENLRDAITVQCLERGLFCQQYHSPFGQLAQELRNADSSLYGFQPDVVVLFPNAANYLSTDVVYNEKAALEFTRSRWRILTRP